LGAQKNWGVKTKEEENKSGGGRVCGLTCGNESQATKGPCLFISPFGEKTFAGGGAGVKGEARGMELLNRCCLWKRQGGNQRLGVLGLGWGKPWDGEKETRSREKDGPGMLF